MPRCQAVHCDHMTGKQKLGFFIIPNPERLRNDHLKNAKERERVTKWFHNIGIMEAGNISVQQGQSTLREALSSRNVPRGHTSQADGVHA